MISKEEINHIAKLSKIKLNEKEIEDFSKEFTETLEYLEIIKEVDLEGVEPTYFINTNKNPLREDIVEESLPLEEVIKNAPDEKYGYFKLPNVMD
ncbi:MAG: Asp-tRNA(Asn)/Glu-tRNA(Gln) amidotransferase subunit GatC [Tissierellia bacterium]|nr:Asp-tRNA(Asn)/Glu-tRNA(Gln) amidotransferase subunit GatC [Tissierellia bacterium]